MEVNLKKSKTFKSPAAFAKWLDKNHACETELWIKMFKKGSGIASINWEEAVVEAIVWGWIDGIVKSFDKVSFHQRFTPRKPNSNWSLKNCNHVERLIADGRMQPAGMLSVQAAKDDGRWDLAYAGQANFEIQTDFLTAIAQNRKGWEQFKKLNRKSLFAIYFRIQSAKRPATRERRIATLVTKLAEGKPIL